MLSSDTNITYNVTIVNDAGISSDINSKLNEYHVHCILGFMVLHWPQNIALGY